MNERGKTYWSSRVQPLSPAGSPTAGGFTASLLRLRWAPIQFSVQITSSASQKKASGVRRSHSPAPHPPTNTTLV